MLLQKDLLRRLSLALAVAFFDGGAAFARADLVIGAPAPSGSLLSDPEKWSETRKYVSGVVWADHALVKLPDDELRQRFEALRRLNCKLQLEVGVIKEWSPQAKRTFQIESPNWDRFLTLGAPIGSIAMDEPLDKALGYFQKPETDAASEVANFIKMVRRKYPGIKIGDIEPFPSVPLEIHAKWLHHLSTLLAASNLPGLDFYRIDPDWMRFQLNPASGWRDVKAIEGAAHGAGSLFSLIYWAADYPSKRAKGVADDSTWYTGVMHQGYAYLAVGGKPDEYVVQSWVSAPSRVLPEDADFTFTKSVLDFARKFVP